MIQKPLSARDAFFGILVEQTKVMALVLGLVVYSSGGAARAATLSGTFSGTTSGSSTVIGIPVTGSFSIGPQSGTNSPNNGPGYLDYIPDLSTVSISFTSQLGTFTSTNLTDDAEILLGDFGSGIQSLIVQIGGDTPASLTLSSTGETLFSNSATQYSGSLGVTGYAEYLGGGMDEGLNFTSLSINGPLTTPLPPPAAVSAVPLPSAWTMMASCIAVLLGLVALERRMRGGGLFSRI